VKESVNYHNNYLCKFYHTILSKEAGLPATEVVYMMILSNYLRNDNLLRESCQRTSGWSIYRQPTAAV